MNNKCSYKQREKERIEEDIRPEINSKGLIVLLQFPTKREIEKMRKRFID